MKNLKNKIKRIIAYRILHIVLLFIVLLPSCGDYLDVVPDNTLKLENIYSSREQALNALAKIYSYMPRDKDYNSNTWLLGDEWMHQPRYDTDAGVFRAIRIMRGLQSGTTPILGTWSGTDSGRPLYEAIRQTNVFLAYIGLVKDMSELEKTNWIAQAKFLKAYYSFLLLRQYGPIVIADELIAPDAPKEKLYLKRSKVDDCFDYIVRLMGEAIPDMQARASLLDLGQIDRVGAAAIKTRVLLYRASPFFSGNMEYFGDFLDHDGQPFFPVNDNSETKKAKWKDAADAAEEAIKIALENGAGMYSYENIIYDFDKEDMETNGVTLKTLYDLRMLIADPWNRELLWGNSDIDYTETSIIFRSQIRNIPGQYIAPTSSFCSQDLGATYRMLERYYTKNGLPIDDDLTFDRTTMYNITTIPGVDDPAYHGLEGVVQAGAQTINLYLNREMRFYANLGITGGYWRSHQLRIPTMMFSGTPGGHSSSFNDYYFVTGIGVQKLIHPDNSGAHQLRIIRCPLPIIRMADLYLMKAEALNEYSGPSPEVYAAINMVRKRAGIPDVETVWANAALVKPASLNKHLTQDGMRDIILQERGIEFAFEGIRFYDMLRHKKALVEFSSPVRGWNHTGTSAETFFVLSVKQARKFTITDYLWPIDLNEMNTNRNLIQNPGW
jgi:hypothetical protein